MLEGAELIEVRQKVQEIFKKAFWRKLLIISERRGRFQSGKFRGICLNMSAAK